MNHSELERRLLERGRVGVEDAVLLPDYTSQQAFIDNLNKRYARDIIYTYIGNVLISLNPYSPLPIYGRDVVALYQKKHSFENPPHIFAVTESSYSNLRDEQIDQCILISGESGSGKTEASKKVLEYIAAVTGDRGQVRVVKDKLLLSNPVLEAFGNAKTKRNDNSSRFGKYMDIQFNYLGDPVGGNILNYLLEKSRVVHQNAGERNFHIFHQVLNGDDKLLNELRLKRDPSMYHYISQTSRLSEGIDDETQMKVVLDCMERMGLSEREVKDIFAIIGAILHLGNITMEDNNDKSRISHRFHLQAVADLLGCHATDLEEALTERSLEARGEYLRSPLDMEMAEFARDALSKALYDRLFSWLVLRLNQSLQPDETDDHRVSVLGILDIYGFEIFQQNSFEQFCINYCNEKLQELMLDLTLRSEQEEYQREGIDWQPIEYFSNTVICHLIEEPHRGIISILDEECLRPGETSDLTFLKKMETNLWESKYFIGHKKADRREQKLMGREEFKLIHYAGEVTYNVTGFLNKNNDLLFRDLCHIMCNTRNSITKSVFMKCELESKRRPETVITQFKKSLTKLIKILKAKVPSYIRCIKPNHYKKSKLFDEDVVRHQVQYLGLMENLRVRRAGFAYRRPYQDFIQRYKSLCPRTWPNYICSDKEAVQHLVDHLQYAEGDYCMGKTKIFIRESMTLFMTEDRFQERKNELAAIIQSHWKGLLQRRKYEEMRKAAIVIEAWVRRFLARRLAARRRAAVNAIRNFIQGFITRNGPVTELNKKFIQSAKQEYLMRLAKHLPPSILSRGWPSPPHCCKKASEELRVIYKKYLARKYRMSLTEEKRQQLQLKVLAESLFKDKKKSYKESVEVWFEHNRLTSTQNMLKNTYLNSDGADEDLEYCSGVIKYDRHGYKKRDWILLVTRQNIHLLMEDKKHFRVKHKVPLTHVISYEVTSEKDNFLLIRLPLDTDKAKGDVILEVPHLLEALTFITTATSQPTLININNIENGCIIHHMANGKEKSIAMTKGLREETGISKGKSGNLVVVG